jgi:hypothetical protein
VTHLGSFIDWDPRHPSPLLNCFRAEGPEFHYPTVLEIQTLSGPNYEWLGGGSEANLSACQQKNRFPQANREGGHTSAHFKWRFALWNTDGTGTPLQSDWMSPKSVAYSNVRRQIRCTISTSD